jgi:hypothetical protein
LFVLVGRRREQEQARLANHEMYPLRNSENWQ